MRRQRDQDEGLNLLPVMNLVTILIPLLLLGAQFAHLAIIESTVPAITPAPDTPPPAPPLSLSVTITRDGFTVLGAELILIEEHDVSTVPCNNGACGQPEDYDYAELTRVLALVKDAFPDEENVVLVPDETVPYEVLIGTMDATRVSGVRPLFPQVSIAGGVAG